MSGFEHTIRRPASETQTGPVPTVPPPRVADDVTTRRRHGRPVGLRTIAVVGVGGGAGATTIAAGLVATLAEAGAGVAVTDHVGGSLQVRALAGPGLPPPSVVVADLGPHALDAPEVLAHAGDVVVMVARWNVMDARVAAEVCRAMAGVLAGRAELVLLVLTETEPASRSSMRRAATAAGQAPHHVLLRWDPALAGIRPVDAVALSDGTRTALARLREVLAV